MAVYDPMINPMRTEHCVMLYDYETASPSLAHHIVELCFPPLSGEGREGLLPFGELFIEERTTWNTPYKFSGKELDEETGYSYFGARYYDPNISIWLSVDPLSDKYPNLSPYSYTSNNPLNVIDPDGRYLFGLFGSTKDQRSAAKSFAADNKGRVVNMHKRNISVFYEVQRTFTGDKPSMDLREQSFARDGSLISQNGEIRVESKTNLDKVGEAMHYPSEIIGAASDFAENYNDMREADWIDADKYFHAKANFEATHRGAGGEKFAELFSGIREMLDYGIKGDPASACAADQQANRYGRKQAHEFKLTDFKEALKEYRPKGLPDEY